MAQTNGTIGREYCRILSWFKYRDNSNVLQRLGKVMGVEKPVEDMGEEGNRTLGKTLQCHVRDTVTAKGLVDLKTPDDFLNLVSSC